MEKAFVSSRSFIEGELRPGAVIVSNGIIDSCHHRLPADFKGEVFDFGEDVLAPALVDTHVHINEPGRTEWEGFQTATEAALAGGITTIVDMPLNCTPVTTSEAALQSKLASLGEQLACDCAFWGGVTPDSLDDLDALLAAGVVGVKAFLIDSGIDDFRPLDWDGVARAMPIVKKHGLPFLFHAEWDRKGIPGPPSFSSYESFAKSRPAEWEDEAIARIIELARVHRCRVHIVHLASAGALGLIRQAKADGVAITAETCPHYLLLSYEDIDRHYGPKQRPLFKCCPPIRSRQNQELLWQGLEDGTIDFIVSDHSPCVPGLKKLQEGDLAGAWGGIASLQLGLPLIINAAEARGYDISWVLQKMTAAPTVLLPQGLSKGALAPGYQADIIRWTGGSELTITKSDIKHRHKISPYEGQKVGGSVQETYLRGELVYQNGAITPERSGKALLFSGENNWVIR